MHTYTGAELRALRIKRGLCQRELAERLGLTTQYICLLETGRRPVSLKLLRRMAEKMDMSFTLTIRNPQL